MLISMIRRGDLLRLYEDVSWRFIAAALMSHCLYTPLVATCALSDP